MIFFQSIKAQSNVSPAIRVHFLTETVLGELTKPLPATPAEMKGNFDVHFVL